MIAHITEFSYERKIPFRFLIANLTVLIVYKKSAHHFFLLGSLDLRQNNTIRSKVFIREHHSKDRSEEILQERASTSIGIRNTTIKVTMAEDTNGNRSTKSSTPNYYNSGSVEASTDTALVIKRLEAVSFFSIVCS